jgi:hypothetical protein
MADLARTEELFFTKTGMDRARVDKIVAEALSGMDDGELYLEWSQSESLGLRPARAVRRIGGLCPCLGAFGSGDPACRGDRAHGAARP